MLSVLQFKPAISCERGEFNWEGAGPDSLQNRLNDSLTDLERISPQLHFR